MTIWAIRYDMGGGATGLCGSDLRVIAYFEREEAEKLAADKQAEYPGTSYRSVAFVEAAK